MKNQDLPIDPHKDILGASREALKVLTDTGKFRLVRLELHEEYGDSLVAVLASDAGITVMFIREGFDVYCKLVIEGLPISDTEHPNHGRDFYIRDVLESLGIEPPPSFMGGGSAPMDSSMKDRDLGFVKMLSATSGAIIEHWPELIKAFDDDHRAETVKTIKRHVGIRAEAYTMQPITSWTTLAITRICYDEARSEVSLTELSSLDGIDLRFTWDGKKAAAEIRLSSDLKRWLCLDQVLQAIGLNLVGSERADPVSLEYAVTKSLLANWPFIAKALSPGNHSVVTKAIAAIAAKKRIASS